MNRWFLIATFELLLASAMYFAGQMLAGAILSLAGCVLLVIGMARTRS